MTSAQRQTLPGTTGRERRLSSGLIIFPSLLPRFTKWLSKNRKLQGIPPSAFFCQEHKNIGENFIRFCFIKHDDSLLKAQEILQNWRKELDN